MNDWIKIIMGTAAIIYGMTAPLPANEAGKETQESINKWYEQFSTSVSKDAAALGTTIQQLPENISAGVSNFIEESKQYQKEQWQKSSELNQKYWESLKDFFGPRAKEIKKND